MLPYCCRTIKKHIPQDYFPSNLAGNRIKSYLCNNILTPLPEEQRA